MTNELVPNEAALLTVEDFAPLISYHPESIRRAIRQGRIRALPFGTSWRISPGEVRRILAEGLPYRSNTKASGSTRRSKAVRA